VLDSEARDADDAPVSPADPVALVRAAWDAQAREGLLALLPFAHPDLHARFERFVRALTRAGVEVAVSADQFEEHDACVVVAGRLRVYSPGAHSDSPMHWTVDVRDGLITSVEAAPSRSAARDACVA
jgi:ketosteroid isomerase-like protein